MTRQVLNEMIGGAASGFDNEPPYKVIDKTTGDIKKVFVYGTLKKSRPNNIILGDSELAGLASIDGFSMIHCGAFPAIFRDSSNWKGKVYGEIYKVNARTLAALDSLEGVPSLYQRIEIYIAGHAYIFVYVQASPVADYPRIMSGVWEGTDTPTIISPPPFSSKNLPWDAYKPPHHPALGPPPRRGEIIPFQPRESVLHLTPKEVDAGEYVWGRPQIAGSAPDNQDNNGENI